MHRSSDGAHQLSGGAIELHLQGSVVGESKQHVPAPGCPVGRGPEVCRWDGLLAEDGVNSMVGREDPYGSLSFNYESLNLPRELEGLCGLGWKVIEYFEQIQSSATLFFDKSTGRLRYIFTGFMDEHTNYMPPEILRMHLHALCDEAVRG